MDYLIWTLIIMYAGAPWWSIPLSLIAWAIIRFIFNTLKEGPKEYDAEKHND